MSDVPTRISAIMIDCSDPDALMDFWGEVAGVQAEHRYPDYVFSTKIPGNHIRLAFQRVPEGKTVKNRLHLDLGHADPEELIARVVALGGSMGDAFAMGDLAWTMMYDPEGNEFCVTALH